MNEQTPAFAVKHDASATNLPDMKYVTELLDAAGIDSREMWQIIFDAEASAKGRFAWSATHQQTRDRVIASSVPGLIIDMKNIQVQHAQILRGDWNRKKIS